MPFRESYVPQIKIEELSLHVPFASFANKMKNNIPGSVLRGQLHEVKKGLQPAVFSAKTERFTTYRTEI